MAEQYNFRRSEAINLFYSTINARMDQEGLGQRTDLAETKHELRARPYKLDYAPKVDAATGNPYILNITEEEDPTEKDAKIRRPAECVNNSDQYVGSISIGYGEMTQSSVQHILDKINSLGEPYSIGPNSILLDFGSGTGKIVYHTFLATQAAECWGVEYVAKRHEFAQQMCSIFLKKIQDEDAKNKQADKLNEKQQGSPVINIEKEDEYSLLLPVRDLNQMNEKCNFVCGDGITLLFDMLNNKGVRIERKKKLDLSQSSSASTYKGEYETELLPKRVVHFTHVWMFDRVFSLKTFRRLCSLLDKDEVRVITSTKPLKMLQKYGLRGFVDSGKKVQITTTGHEGITMFIYIRPQIDNQEAKQGYAKANCEIDLEEYEIKQNDEYWKEEELLTKLQEDEENMLIQKKQEKFPNLSTKKKNHKRRRTGENTTNGIMNKDSQSDDEQDNESESFEDNDDGDAIVQKKSNGAKKRKRKSKSELQKKKKLNSIQQGDGIVIEGEIDLEAGSESEEQDDKKKSRKSKRSTSAFTAVDLEEAQAKKIETVNRRRRKDTIEIDDDE